MSFPNTTSTNRELELIEAVAAEVSVGIDRAVSFWMNQIDDVLHDSRLTTLGRLQAVKDVVGNYRHRHAVDFVNDHGNPA
jgi:hypothetical protein